MKNFWPSREDLDVLGRMAALMFGIPALIIVIGLAVIFGWTVATALIVLSFALLGAAVLLVVAALVQSFFLHARKKRTGL